jgi:hypothetical protein
MSLPGSSPRFRPDPEALRRAKAQRLYRLLTPAVLAPEPPPGIKPSAWQTAARRRLVHCLAKGGYGPPEIARAVGVDEAIVRDMLATFRPSPPDPVAMADFYEHSGSLRHVAEAFGVSHEHARKLLLHHGVELRPRGGRLSDWRERRAP